MTEHTQKIITQVLQLPFDEQAAVIEALQQARTDEPDSEATAEDAPQHPGGLSHDEWVRKFNAFIAEQKPRNPDADDSRESIYFGS